MTQSNEAKTNNPFDEILGRAQKAYNAYLDAQKDIWVAYRETEQQTENDFITTEANAYTALNAVLTQAAQIQKDAEKQADEAYLKAKELSKVAFNHSTQQAMEQFNSTIKQAWEKRKTALTQAWSIFVK